MALESVLVFGLALRDFWLAATLTATIGSVTLLAISGVCFWAAYATWVQDASWRGTSLLAQFSIAVLAGYTVLIDARSPLHQITVGVIIACILGLIAIFWVVYLLRHRSGLPLPKWTPTIVALIPALGFVQFWVQTDYLPRTSLPLVDVTTDLAPKGKTGDIVQLEAKVTINNRGSVPVYVGATVMRITAYPKATGAQTELPAAVPFGIQASTPYRDDPLRIDQRTTLYARDLLPVAQMMAAGESNTYRKVVDFNSRTMRLARLAVDGIFMTSPNVDEVYTCPVPLFKTWSHDLGWWGRTPVPPPVSEDKDGFQAEISNPIYEKVDGKTVSKKLFCREIRLKPRNVIHEITGDHPDLEIIAIFEDPTNPALQTPALLRWWGVNGNYLLTSRQWQRVSDANPTLVYDAIPVEYSPSDQPAPPLGGTPSTSQPTSTTKPP
jgi:hypothetical protein